MANIGCGKIAPIGKFFYEGKFVPIIGIGHRIEDFLAMDLFDMVNVMAEGAVWFKVSKASVMLNEEVLNRYRGEESR